MNAILFRLAHADQGVTPALWVGLYGVGLGAIARWRGSLRPGIACHVAVDLLGGVLRG